MMMPEWAARTFIKILDVRPERVQEITEGDAIAEGVVASYLRSWRNPKTTVTVETATEVYARLWDSINKKNPWASNPWVWKITFAKVDRP